jgi:hypothetical protein
MPYSGIHGSALRVSTRLSLDTGTDTTKDPGPKRATNGPAGPLTCDDAVVRRDEGPSAKPLLDKLGVKPGMRVSVIDVPDPEFVAELVARGADVSTRRRARSDLLFVGFEDRERLARLRTHRGFIAADGAIWVVWPKGRKELNENHVRETALESGLVDVKVVAFSDSLSALKLVIRVADR